MESVIFRLSIIRLPGKLEIKIANNIPSWYGFFATNCCLHKSNSATPLTFPLIKKNIPHQNLGAVDTCRCLATITTKKRSQLNIEQQRGLNSYETKTTYKNTE